MTFQQREFSDFPLPPPVGTPANSPSAQPWYSIAPGIWELLLNGDKDSDHKSVLQWFEPGQKSAQTEPITHSYVEEVCFLQGGLRDLTLNREWGMGAYAYRKPGMKHGPYQASTVGCLEFVRITPK
ncbi:hypothetical protein EYZ11_003894 [Aspergillus tanneri]|uniref:ChrR-like cupin domain-containing protein n=1 Tax=Aspergillus tanneri TaxID=1220188 RepID=A0A4V6RQW1_9EURO|nr:uncharacterized protein ATNIH1004_009364 [Aspergillus tanneri]KAA8645147.1 hypothetical protein ATNIH1004_009364 [Aspergillus tanneri]THC96644.1 hypothetical protein EYZ11_003894 [Aspergillus tanneri]